MTVLELKIPPVILVLLFALAMWGASLLVPPLTLPLAVRAFVCAAFFIAGAAISIAGVVSFIRARTTVNPTNPNATSALVTSGVYRFTRNPMYLGFWFFLLVWAVYLSNPLALICAFVYVPYMNRFQIEPEERALSVLFGLEFLSYKSRVRRWL